MMENGGLKAMLCTFGHDSLMLIALPNMDGSFTVTLFYPAVGPDSFETLNTAEAVEAFFAKEFPDVKALIPESRRRVFQQSDG